MVFTRHSMTASDRLRAEIDLGALRQNVRFLRSVARGANLMSVVKANAYGHGVGPVVETLLDEGVRHFAVATLDEGIALRERGVGAFILVLAAPLPSDLPGYAQHNLAVTISSAFAADAVRAYATPDSPLTVHVEVDTGMHRIGVRPAEAPSVLRRLRAAPGVTVDGLMTHFATTDAVHATCQMDRFDALVAACGEGRVPHVHVANSEALLGIPRASEGRSLVRVGGALYGLIRDQLGEQGAAALRPVMRFVTRVVHLQTIAAGEAVSYGRTWIAEHPTRIATLAVGYGDGLPRALSNRGVVGVGERLVPIVGRVCMDMTMVSLGRPSGPGAKVGVGDDAVLWGAGGASVLDVADLLKTTPYTLPCGLSGRVRRVFRHGVPDDVHL